jgi:hypothetical protein
MLATTLSFTPFRWRSLALAVVAILTWLDVTLLVARDAPSAPFLQKNSFYLESAGFKARFANDPASQAVLRKMPPHRFVMHATPNGPRYFYAEPVTCKCIFVGTAAAYTNYRDILAEPIQQPDFVSKDYKTQASALLADDPVASDGIDWEPDSLSAAFRDYW